MTSIPPPASKDDIEAAIRAIDERLGALRGRILKAGDTALAEGTWHVRDALSHLAARANGVDRVVQRALAAENPSAPQPPAPRSIDDINAGQVEERRDRSIEDLLAEIEAGHAAAITAARALDDELLGRMLPLGFRPGEAAVADMILRGGPGHDGNHLDQIEAVLVG